MLRIFKFIRAVKFVFWIPIIWIFLAGTAATGLVAAAGLGIAELLKP